MTVVAMPDKDPTIIGTPKLVSFGEQLLLNCFFDYSLLPSDINWYIDDEIVKTEPWHRLELSAPQAGGLRASWRVLRVAVPASGALRVRCEARLPVEPPVLRDAAATVAVHARTLLSKYVSNEVSRKDKRPGRDLSNKKSASVFYKVYTIISLFLSVNYILI